MKRVMRLFKIIAKGILIESMVILLFSSQSGANETDEVGQYDSIIDNATVKTILMRERYYHPDIKIVFADTTGVVLIYVDSYRYGGFYLLTRVSSCSYDHDPITNNFQLHELIDDIRIRSIKNSYLEFDNWTNSLCIGFVLDKGWVYTKEQKTVRDRVVPESELPRIYREGIGWVTAPGVYLYDTPRDRQVEVDVKEKKTSTIALCLDPLFIEFFSRDIEYLIGNLNKNCENIGILNQHNLYDRMNRSIRESWIYSWDKYITRLMFHKESRKSVTDYYFTNLTVMLCESPGIAKLIKSKSSKKSKRVVSPLSKKSVMVYNKDYFYADEDFSGSGDKYEVLILFDDNKMTGNCTVCLIETNGWQEIVWKIDAYVSDYGSSFNMFNEFYRLSKLPNVGRIDLIAHSKQVKWILDDAR